MVLGVGEKRTLGGESSYLFLGLVSRHVVVIMTAGDLRSALAAGFGVWSNAPRSPRRRQSVAGSFAQPPVIKTERGGPQEGSAAVRCNFLAVVYPRRAPPNRPPSHPGVTHGRERTPDARLGRCHQGLRSSQHSA
jgi:hypothetical protein